jgi:4-hydroxy-4-methyl-2-oxoglutarate aldolase
MTAQLSALSSALIASAAGERVQIVCGLEPASPGTVALGPALTVRVHPGDNLAVHLAVARAAAGPVIIVDACGEPNVAFTGGLVVCAAALTGVAGIVVDGAIRDRADIAPCASHLPSRTSPRAAAKHFPGELQVPIELRGVSVSPGDLVCVDDDGLAVVGAANSAAVLEDTRAVEAREAGRRGRVVAGESTLTILGIESPTHNSVGLWLDDLFELGRQRVPRSASTARMSQACLQQRPPRRALRPARELER